MAVQVKSRVLRAVDGIIAGHVGQQLKFCAAGSVCVKGCLQISKSPPRAVALAIVQGCFSHRGRVAVGTVGAIKAVRAAVAARCDSEIAPHIYRVGHICRCYYASQVRTTATIIIVAVPFR